MTNTRRLSAEGRMVYTPDAIDRSQPEIVRSLAKRAPHDLDLADAERDKWRGKYEAAEQHNLILKGSHDYALRTVEQLRAELAQAQAEALARTHEREHFRQRCLEAEQKLQAMTESRDFWKQIVKDSVPVQDHDITSET